MTTAVHGAHGISGAGQSNGFRVSCTSTILSESAVSDSTSLVTVAGRPGRSQPRPVLLNRAAAPVQCTADFNVFYPWSPGESYETWRAGVHAQNGASLAYKKRCGSGDAIVRSKAQNGASTAQNGLELSPTRRVSSQSRDDRAGLSRGQFY